MKEQGQAALWSRTSAELSARWRGPCWSRRRSIPKPQIDAGADDVGGVVDVDEGGRQEAVLGVQRYAVGAEVVCFVPLADLP